MDSLKTLWRENSSKNIWSFFCPQCRIPRRVPYRPSPGLRHYAQIALTTTVFVILTWRHFGLKGAVAFVPIWSVFEFIYRSRVRAALNCENCGFDPILYLVDVKRARREIEQHWRKKLEERGIPYPGSNAAQQTGAGAESVAGQTDTRGVEEELAHSDGPSGSQ